MGSGGKAAGQLNVGGDRPHPYQQLPYRKELEQRQRQSMVVDEVGDNKLYVGNLEHRVKDSRVAGTLLRSIMTVSNQQEYQQGPGDTSTIKREEFLYHVHGPRKGEPRGYAFVEFYRRAEAEAAKEHMNGKLAFGRPLVVRFVEEKIVTHNAEAPVRTHDLRGPRAPDNVPAKIGISKSAKIAAIQNKLKLMEKENK
eukprot:jgi/Mesen1/2167/ME000152S01253